MSDAVVLAFGASTPLGEGEQSLSDPTPGRAARVAVVDDATLRAAGFARAAAARVVDLERGPFAAQALVERVVADCVRGLSRARPTWRDERVGLALGTSSGNMPGVEHVIRCIVGATSPPREVCAAAHYGGPFMTARAALGVPLVRSANLLLACASSAFALAIAHTWLEIDACDVVFAGGYDVISELVAAGFVALGAVTASLPRPFRERRDGLALGEGAALVALVRADRANASVALGCISGAGASTDAVHITAPDRSGSGLLAAAQQALVRGDLGASDIGMVSAHGTATPFNDSAEAATMFALFGDASTQPPVHAMKAEIGHLMGAGSVVETLAAARALDRGVALASAGGGPLDPALAVAVRLLETNVPCEARALLKLSSAFGGANVALVLRKSPRPSAARVQLVDSDVIGEGWAAPDRSLEALALRLGIAADRLSRTDDLSRLSLDAVAELAESVGRPRIASSGLIVGHDFATMATNEAFYGRILARGPRAAEPRRFPATSPNACVGEVAIAFGMHGLSLAIGGFPNEPSGAERLARDCIAGSLATSIVVVEVWAGRSRLASALDEKAAQLGPRARARLFVATTIVGAVLWGAERRPSEKYVAGRRAAKNARLPPRVGLWHRARVDLVGMPRPCGLLRPAQ